MIEDGLSVDLQLRFCNFGQDGTDTEGQIPDSLFGTELGSGPKNRSLTGGVYRF